MLGQPLYLWVYLEKVFRPIQVQDGLDDLEVPLELRKESVVDWVEYGKDYGQLRHDLGLVGESIVGVQVDIKRSEEYPALCPGGLHLIGDIEAGGDVSGEGYRVIENVIVVRYRRLLTAEQLGE